MIKISINAEALDTVMKAMQMHGAELDRLAEMERETLMILERDNRGPWAMEDAKAKIEVQREAARQRVRELVAQQKAAFFDDVNRQSFPDGSQINSHDYELLRGGIVNSPDELAPLRDRYAQNPAMRRAIAQYAAAKKWDGFSDETNADAARAFGEKFFEMAAHGAEAPNSYNGMLVADKMSVTKLVSDYGLFPGA